MCFSKKSSCCGCSHSEQQTSCHGPICQSCGMPLSDETLIGTNTDGSKNNEFCIHCYVNGAYTNPNITIDQMTEKVIGALIDKNIMDDTTARTMVPSWLPQLKRWKK